MVNWTGYLESVCTTYAQWWDVYTLTDVIGRQQVKPERSPLLLDFMVQTVQSAKEERGEAQQKTEHLGVLEGLRKYASEHVLLIGRPGSGKSTALARLLLEEAQKALTDQLSKIPVLVELRYYKNSVLDLVQGFLQRHDPALDLDDSTLKSWLRQGLLLLLVDGLNELPSDAARSDLTAFRQNYPATRMIFTTRDLGVGGDLKIAKKLEMQPLTEAQMRQFVRAYLSEQGEKLLRQLGDRLREFGQTPLLLWMLCSLFKKTGMVPPNLGLVFRQFTQSYDEQLKQDVWVTDDSRRWWPLLLQHLAFKMTQGREPTELQVAIPKQEAQEILTAFLRDEQFDQPRNRALSWLEDLLKYHLIQVGAGDKIEFRHQLIQEYYTAERLLKQLPHLSNDSLKGEYLNYLKWTEPLTLMLELVEQKAQAERVVRLALEVDLRLGARLAGSVKLEFQAQTVALLAGLEVPQKAKIVLLEITRSDNAIPSLLQALNHEDYDVCSNAVKALENIGSEAAVAALLQALNDEDSDVRISAVNALGNFSSEAAVLALLQALNDEDSAVRSNAAEALGNFGGEAAVSALLQALNDEDFAFYFSVLNALGKIGGEAAVSALLQALNDEYYLVRIRAAYWLGKIGSEAAVPALLQALNDEDSDVRIRAAEALGNIGSEATVPALLQALNFGSEASVPALLQALNDEDSSVRRRAAEALGNISSKAAVPALLQALNDEDEDSSVRRRAAEALGNIGSEAAVPALLQALNDEDSSIRSQAAEALGNIGNEVAVSALMQALKDENSSVRSRAAKALGNIASSELIPIFLEFIETSGEGSLFNTIAAIQERCKYYNPTLILPIKPISIPLMHILHLSDLHFGTSDNAQVWYTQLASDLRRELNCTHLDTVILSGDIANLSSPQEYDAAKFFLDKLCKGFQLKPDQIVIVPGNHDLNWGVAKTAYKLMEREDYQGELQESCYIPVDDSVIRVRDEALYQQRFAHFNTFYEAIKGEPYPLEYEKQGILHHFPDQKLLILGLNSAWQLDHHYKSRASIHPIALSNALEQIDENYTTYEECLKIAVWHHPLDSAFPDRITDQGFMEQLAVAGFRLFLHGHIHRAETSLYRYDLSTNGRKLDRVCAGTFGAPIREWVPGYPLQYNLLKLEGNKLSVQTRRREELNGAWKPDARWLQGAGQNPLPYYEIQLFAE